MRRERPLAMMPSAKRVPTKSSHSEMPWHMWVVPLPGYRPAQCIIVSSPLPNLWNTVTAGIVPSGSSRNRFAISFTLGHDRPGHPRHLVGERHGGDPGRPAGKKLDDSGSLRAMPLGISDDRQCSNRQHRAQVSVALLGDATEPLIAAAQVLLWCEPDPGRKVARRRKGSWIRDRRNQGGREQRANARDLRQSAAHVARAGRPRSGDPCRGSCL
jgi:hypothetical protein